MARVKKATDDMFLEEALAHDLKVLIKRAVDELKQVDEFEDKDIAKLEKLTRAYSTMMGDLRESIKHGTFGNKSDAELEQLTD